MKFAQHAAVLAAANAGLLAMPLAAKDEPVSVYQADQVIESFDISLIETIAVAHGYTVDDDEAITEGELLAGISVTNQLGQTALIAGSTCEDQQRELNCSGLVIARSFSDGAQLDPANIAAASKEFLALKLYLDEDQNLIAERYVVVSGGVTMENIGFNIDLVFDAWDVVRPYVIGEKPLED